MIILYIIYGYLTQMLVCAMINVLVAARHPKSFWDFLKLTFLPWLLLHLDEVRNE